MNRWQLDLNAKVTDEEREKINAYIDRVMNRKKVVLVIPKDLKIIYGSCPKEE